jgi:quercetin dioxygenase-like cupin family protein
MPGRPKPEDLTVSAVLACGDALYLPPSTPLSLPDLAELIRDIAADRRFWSTKVRIPDLESRWWTRLWADPEFDIWLLSWLPGQLTGLHDHGDSAAAFTVVEGVLAETRIEAGRPVSFTHRTGDIVWIAPGAVHDVHGAGTGPAVSVHVYSPPLSRMTYYDPTGRRPVRTIPTDSPEQELQR